MIKIYYIQKIIHLKVCNIFIIIIQKINLLLDFFFANLYQNLFNIDGNKKTKQNESFKLL